MSKEFAVDFLRNLGLNYSFQIEGSKFNGSLLDLLRQYRKESKKWIPLQTGMDELPELKDENVLVLFENGSIETVHIEDYFKDITSGLNEDGSQAYTKWYITQPVTHWMELPDKP